MLKQKCYGMVTTSTYKKRPILKDIKYIIRHTLSTSKTQYLTPFLKIYIGMEVNIGKILYPNIGIVNGIHISKSKNLTINRYQLPLAPAFCSINFKTQGQTLDHLIINLYQPLDNVQLNMHNVYVMLPRLHSINGLIIIQDITIQDINITEFKKGSIDR
jgi:hypothetical protein